MMSRAVGTVEDVEWERWLARAMEWTHDGVEGLTWNSGSREGPIRSSNRVHARKGDIPEHEEAASQLQTG